MKRYYCIWLLAIGFWLLTACDKTSMNEQTISAPHIEAFSPTSGSIGTDIVITGSSLDDVVSAAIGGESVELVEKVSNQRLTIRVTGAAKSGPITLKNNVGETESEEIFTVEHPVPTINASSIPQQLEMGNKLLIRGQHLNVISAVIFTAVGATEGHEAAIVSQSAHEIVVKVPYVERDDAHISFRYFDGTKDVVTPESAVPQVVIARYQPNVTTTTFAPAYVGEVITLEGTYMNKIDKVLLGSIECVVTSQTETQLKFLVPTSDTFADGDNLLPLSIVYFDGIETKVLAEQFTVKVPFVYFWKDRTVWGQGRDVPEMASFFSPETGIAYHNSLWRDKLDPISYQKQAATCSAAQKPAVTEQEYNSVVPYFFFSGVNAGNLQINSPAGSTGQLKNFYFQNNSANDYRVTGANANCYGTPVMTYLYLNPSTASHQGLISEIANGGLEKIDEATFPIDTDAKTCRGISISSVANTVNQTVFAPGIFTVGQEKSADIDAYMMVFYYNYLGLDANNKSLNIKRIGILHIKHIDFKMWNNTSAPSSSGITFDMYWMKHDYDYSK